MEPSRRNFYRGLFLIAAIYDLSIGVVFTFFSGWAFELLGIRDKMPQGAYIPLLGAFLFVIGVAYWLIYLGDLHRNHDLIVVGTLYKFAYASIAFVFWARGQSPHLIFPALFGVVDLVFLVLMLECLVYLRANPLAAVGG